MWSISYYSRKVFEEIKGLPRGIKARYLALTEKMQECGPDLGMPHTRFLEASLFEIRVKSQEGIARAFYCTQKGKEIMILHSFIKKTQKTPKKELEIARSRLKEVNRNGK